MCQMALVYFMLHKVNHRHNLLISPVPLYQMETRGRASIVIRTGTEIVLSILHHTRLPHTE